MDKEKFIDILKENKWVLYKVINTYCHDYEDRKDLEQEILIQLWKSHANYNAQYKMSTWIYKVAMNVAISYYRSNLKRKTKTSPINEAIFQLKEDTAPLSEESKLLHDFINQLDEFNREIMVLYLDDLRYREIAEVVGISESNVGTKINRFKGQLREYFKKLNKEENGIR